MELRPYRWLPIVALMVAVLGLIMTESILAARGTVEIIRPEQHETLSGVVDIYGSATNDAFAYYQLEYSPSGLSWTPIGEGRCTRQVRDGLLGRWDTRQVRPGRYQLRLSVVDTMGNRTQRTIEVTIQEPSAGGS